MTWIKTVRMEEDDNVKKAIEDERKFYPAEYAMPVPAVFAGVEAEHRGLALAVSRCAVSCVQHVRGFDVSGIAVEAASARNDRDDGVGDEPVPLLNRISRRVSA